MTCKKVLLKDIADDIQTGPFGSQLHQSDYSDYGIPVIMPKDLLNGHISTNTIALVEPCHAERLNRHLVKTDDIVFARRGDVGRCAFVTEKESGWICGTGCIRVRINSNLTNPKFVFYQLQKEETIGWIEKHAVGATMLNLNTSIIGDVPVELPDLSTQNKIVEIISNYDKLIENNQKQIKLLEEAAQRLYKEWFVDLRFPGYENTKIVDGVPEGWKLDTIDSLGKIVTGKTPSTEKSEFYGGEIPFVKIPDMQGVIYPIVTEAKLTSEGAKSQSNKYIPKDSVLISCIGTVGLVNISFENCQTNQQINSIILSDPQLIYYTYFAAKQIKAQLEGVGSNGATMTNVNKSKLSRTVIMIPNTDICDKFHNYCKPIFNKIRSLCIMIEKARNTRDMLLPRLMSGEVEV